MTQKLFYEDSFMKTFSAQVLECCLDEEGYQIVLDRTAFFPEGGGQYADRGHLNQICVTDVQEKDGKIYHKTKYAIEPGTCVEGEIDWAERFMKMQQHSGEHIVSGLVHERFHYKNVGFHLGSENCTMDFDGELTKEELHEIELCANEAVFQNLEVQILYPSDKELAAMEYRSKIEIEGQVRIVVVPGYDVCACCAPHVKRTGEIGLIKLTNVQRYKGGVRVTMLCGSRALRDYDRKLTAVKQIGAALCAKEDETAEAVAHLQEECAQLKQKLHKQQLELLKYKVKEIADDEEFVCLFEEELEGEAPRLLMNQVLDQGHALCAVFCGGKEGAYRYVIGSRVFSLRELVRELNAEFGGRGGGKPEMVQGTLHGKEEELRAWIQKKARMLKDE